MKQSIKNFLLCLAGLAVLSGCTRDLTSEPGDAPNLERWVKQVNDKPTEPLDALPVLTKFEPVPYNASADRDPFSPQTMIDTSSTTGLRPNSERPKQTLEGFALDSLKMVGTMGSGSSMSALLLAPDKITYRVRRGDYLGQSDGRVVSVEEDHIQVVEIVSDGAGGWIEKEGAVSMAE